MMMSFEEKVTFNFEATYNLTKTESLHNVYVVPFLLHHQTERNMYIQTSLKRVNSEFGQYFKVTTTLKVYKRNFIKTNFDFIRFLKKKKTEVERTIC